MKSKNEFNTPEEYKAYLRNYYAGLALQGFLANRWSMEMGSYSNTQKAEEAVLLADELLKALEPIVNP